MTQIDAARKNAVLRESATSSTCDCSFWTAMSLPCEHMLRYRLSNGDELYDESLVAERWQKVYFLESQGLNVDQSAPRRSVLSACRLPCERRPRSQNEKYRRAFQVAQRLAALASEATGGIYDQRVRQLKALEETWKNETAVPSTIDRDNHPETSDFNELLDTRPDHVASVDSDNLTQEQEDELENYIATEYADQDIIDPPIDIDRDNAPPDTITPPAAVDTDTVPSDTVTPLDSDTVIPPDSDTVTPPDTGTVTPPDTDTVTPPDRDNAPGPSSAYTRIKMPPRMPKRGRPRGAETTVVGLPKKRKISRPVPFVKKSATEKESSKLYLKKTFKKKCTHNRKKTLK